MLQIKRVYEKSEANDGFRILVDRLWPRGLKKEEAKVDLWLKDIAPSSDLRKWFGHNTEKWPEFQKKYEKELGVNPSTKELLNQAAHHKNITLVYAAKDEEHNNAVVLKKFLEK